MDRQTLDGIQAQARQISSEIERLIDEDIEAALSGKPISNSVRINRLAQDRNILHGAEDRLRAAGEV